MKTLLLSLLVALSTATYANPDSANCFPKEASGIGSELTLTRDDEITVVTWWCSDMGRMVMVPSSNVSLYVLLNARGNALRTELTRLQEITDYRWIRRGLDQLMSTK